MRESTTTRSLGAIAQRWVVTLHMLALAVQIALALLLLLGSGTLRAHSVNAWVVLSLGAMQAVSVVGRWQSEGKLWKAAAPIVVLAEMLQIHFGRTENLAAHVTLGTVIWALSLALLIQVWAPSW